MNLKELLVPLAFVFGITFFVQSLVHHFGAKQATVAVEQVKSGQSFVVPKKEQLIKPLMTAVDFLDADVKCAGQTVALSTERVQATFETCGGAISSYATKKIPGVEWAQLTTLQAAQPQDRDGLAFLVALNEKTPLNYHLVSESHDTGTHTLTFASSSAVGSVEKTFTFYDASSKVDLTLTVAPRTAEGMQARILLPAPFLQGDKVLDSVRAVMVGDSDSVEKHMPKDVEGRLWVTPSLFGVEDRYFVNALVKDANGFVQRAYYKAQGEKRLIAIFEGPLVQEKTSWKLSFYCGPKAINEFAPVDSRLDATLDYGWLGPLAKAALALLKFIYQFIHSYGFGIIILTLLIKLLLLPFGRPEETARKAQEMKKKLQYIEQKYKDDPELLAREKTELIRKHGTSDLIGCLPMLLQIPIVFALNRALSTAIELYRVPFLWCPDLSSYDPYYVLPILTGVGLVMQGASNSDPRQKLISMLTALLVCAILANLAAGVTIFICTTTWISIGQTHLHKVMKRA